MARLVNYTTLAIIKRRLATQLINIAKQYDAQGEPVTPQAIDESFINDEIEFYSDYIDAKIGTYYTVPLTEPVNKEVSQWCYVLVACQLFNVESEIPEDIDCDAVKKKLDEVSEGKRDITGLAKKAGTASIIEAYPDLERFDEDVLSA